MMHVNLSALPRSNSLICSSFGSFRFKVQVISLFEIRKAFSSWGNFFLLVFRLFAKSNLQTSRFSAAYCDVKGLNEQELLSWKVDVSAKWMYRGRRDTWKSWKVVLEVIKKQPK